MSTAQERKAWIEEIDSAIASNPGETGFDVIAAWSATVKNDAYAFVVAMDHLMFDTPEFRALGKRVAEDWRR